MAYKKCKNKKIFCRHTYAVGALSTFRDISHARALVRYLTNESINKLDIINRQLI